MLDSQKEIDKNRLPKHIAVIMDGNGRWAKRRGMPRVFGHRSGVKAVRECSEAAAELGVEYLTLYAFSTENWNRPATEVSALMGLLVDTVFKEVKTLNENNIKLKAIGALSKLPKRSFDALQKGMEDTSHNTGMTLVLALNYSSKGEILNATKEISKLVKSGGIQPNDISEDTIKQHLYTHDMPDPELMIRTSGEYRISNFLLWQMAYTELCFLDIFWPDFRKENLYNAILDFQKRERRFGKTSEQVK